ncbi:SRPBCC family protein [Streptomyces sp. NPDC053431]|uniref:SRPBCC family protein n=1 Tax=Streptomyces sp. NPDC053431 TaxID=3365703 RepID=UPI0037D45967
MTDTKGPEGRATGGTDTASGESGARKMLDRNPGANRLAEEFESYLMARLDKALSGVGDRIGGAAEKVGEAHIGPSALLRGIGKAGLSSAASSLTKSAAGAKDALMDKVTSGGSDEPRSSASNSGQKNLTIIEDIDVGVPVEEAYNQWTQFQEFSRFAKGVVSVDQQDETTTQWQVKVAKSNRAFTGKITEQVPDERIAWTSEGAKGTTRGVVTFHPLGENLTKVLLVMEYYPKGFFEKAGGLVRAQGRRARLDLKAFRTFVMMKGEATGSWRGEIREGKVVAGPDEEEGEASEDREPDEYKAGEESDDSYEDRDEDEDEDEEEAGEQPEDEAAEPEDYDEEEDEEEDEEGEGEPEGRYDEDEEDEAPEDRYDEEEDEPEDRYDDETDDEEADDDEDAEDESRARRSRKG